jgi:hypothetical protein
MTHETYSIAEEYNEPTSRAIFYVWDNTRLLGAYETRKEAEESIKELAKQIHTA